MKSKPWILGLLLVSFLSSPLFAEGVGAQLNFLKDFNEKIYSVKTDSQGNIFLLGTAWLNGNYTSDQYPTLTINSTGSLGGMNLFVAKFQAGTQELSWITYIGGSQDDSMRDGLIQVDPDGNIFFAGYSFSDDFPLTRNALKTSRQSADVIIAGLSPDGGTLVYSSFFGGSGIDEPYTLAKKGDYIYIGGYTESNDLPNNVNSYTDRGDGFVSRVQITPTQSSVVFTRYIGGPATNPGRREFVTCVRVDESNQVYLSADVWNGDLPKTTASNYVGRQDLYIAKLNDQGELIYGTYFGGARDDHAGGLALGKNGSVFVAGFTNSVDLSGYPISAFMAGFLLQLDPNGVAISSPCIGVDGYNGVSYIETDQWGNAFLIGETGSSNFPVSSNPIQSTLNGTEDLFFQVYDAAGNLQYSTLLGGEGIDKEGRVTITSDGDAVISDQVTNNSGRVAKVKINRSPSLEVPGPVTINEMTEYRVTITAQDPENNLPLIFSLSAGAPEGASINSQTGEFSWTPSEEQGPGTYQISVKVEDSGTPSMSATKSFTININEVNRPPQLDPIANKTVNVDETLSFSAVAIDPDIPANVLRFKVNSMVFIPEEFNPIPTKASINEQTGDFSWNPLDEEIGLEKYHTNVEVYDAGGLSDVEEFDITVNSDKKVQLSTPTYTVHKNEGKAVITVKRIGNPAGAIQVSYTTTFNPIKDRYSDAAEDFDFSYTSGILNWVDGDTADKTFEIPILNNRFAKEDCALGVMLGYPTPGVLVAAPYPAGLIILAQDLQVNQPPVLHSIGNKVIDEETKLAFTASAEDPDLGQILSFSLAEGAPNGATITVAGAFSWTPQEVEGPGNYSITVRVEDNGDPKLSAEETIEVRVNEVNRPVQLETIDDKIVNVGETLTFTAVAFDPDVPVNKLTFQVNTLISAPGEFFPIATQTAINPETGLFIWSPKAEKTGFHKYHTNIEVSDGNGSSISRAFDIYVQSDKQIHFSAAGYTVHKNEGKATITVKRSGSSEGVIEVQYATAFYGGSAESGKDYEEASGTLHWDTGDMADKTFDIQILNNRFAQEDRVLHLMLINPTEGVVIIEPYPATLTILAADIITTPAEISFDDSNLTVNEGVKNFSIQVRRKGGMEGAISVEFKTEDITAKAGEDYQASNGVLTFAAADEGPKEIRIPIINDKFPEPLETFKISLSIKSGLGVFSGASYKVVSIRSDDVPELEAGEEIRVGIGEPFQLNATVSPPMDNLQTLWTLYSVDHSFIGAAPVEISNPEALLTQVVIRQPGDYVFKISGNVGFGFTDYDLVKVRVEAPMGMVAFQSKNLLDLSKGGQAEIIYQLNEPGGVKITIYDRFAREVVQLINQDLGVGMGSQVWSGRDSDGQEVAPGVYTALIREGSRSRKLKIIILK